MPKNNSHSRMFFAIDYNSVAESDSKYNPIIQKKKGENTVWEYLFVSIFF